MRKTIINCALAGLIAYLVPKYSHPLEIKISQDMFNSIKEELFNSKD